MSQLPAACTAVACRSVPWPLRRRRLLHSGRIVIPCRLAPAGYVGIRAQFRARVCQHHRTVQVSALGASVQDFAQPGIVVQIGVPPNRIDLLTSISGVPDFEAAWQAQPNEHPASPHFANHPKSPRAYASSRRRRRANNHQSQSRRAKPKLSPAALNSTIGRAVRGSDSTRWPFREQSEQH